MSESEITDTTTAALIAWARVSCRLFMQGQMPPNFRLSGGKPNEIEGEVVYGDHVFGCTVSTNSENTYRWKAYIFDDSDNNDFYFLTADIMEGV